MKLPLIRPLLVLGLGGLLVLCGGIRSLEVLSLGSRPFAVGISPHRVDANVSVGGIRTVELTLTNLGTYHQSVRVTLVGLSMASTGEVRWLGSDGKDASGEGYHYAEIGSCVSIKPDSFTIPPESQVPVFVHIEAPDEIPTGAMAGRVGALWFDITPQDDSATALGSIVRVVTYVLVQFGDPQLGVEMSTLPLTQDVNGDIRFRVLVANTGTVHFSPVGQVTLREADTGDPIDVIQLSGGTALPECPREYGATWSIPSDLSGSYSAEISVSCAIEQPPQAFSISFNLHEGRLINDDSQGVATLVWRVAHLGDGQMEGSDAEQHVKALW